jgi:hypothetical protein
MKPKKRVVSLSQAHIDLIVEGLVVLANLAETGDPVLSAQDAVQVRKKEKLRALDSSQMRRILRIRDLTAFFRGTPTVDGSAIPF